MGIPVKTVGNNLVELPIELDAAGTGATATVAPDEQVGVMHKTVITLTNLVVPCVSVTTGAGIGGALIYTFPTGRMLHMGTFATLSISVASAQQADFTDGTPEGDIGIGTVIMADADSFGTDAADDDYCTGTAVVMAAFAQTGLQVKSDATPALLLNEDVNVNVLIDAADIDDDATSSVLVSGTVTIYYIKVGDV